MTILLDYDPSPPANVEARLANLRKDIDRWIGLHVEQIHRLGPIETTTCGIGGRHFAGYECFDCDFSGSEGKVHCVTISVCHANQLEDMDAQVVDSVAAMTLIGMLLQKVGIRPTVSPV